MPPFVLLALKVVFLALLYLFVYRVVRAVAVDVRRTRRSPAPAAGPAAAAATARMGSRGRPPRTLVVTDERGGKPRSFRLNGNLQIGRADGSDVKLEDTYASSNHARIYSRDDTWFVEDLGSTNGTYLNQRRLTAPAELRAGDKIKIGKTLMEARR